VEIKAKYFLLEPKCGAWRQNGGRLGDVTEAGRPVLQGLEVILQILRLRGHFCRDHGASAPPPLPRYDYLFYHIERSYDQLEPQAHVLLTVKSVFIRESLDLIPALSYMSHHNKEMLQEVQSDQDIGSYEKWL